MIMLGGDSFESFKQGQQKVKFHPALSLLEEKEIWIKADKGSLTRLILKTSEQYLGGDVSAQEKSTNNELLMLIFNDPVMQFFQMIDDPNFDFEPILDIGFDLEKRGLLPDGITNKSYARRLQSEIKRQGKLSKPENQNEFKEYNKKLTELTNEGFSPLTDEEASPIIEEMIARILMKK